MEYIPLGGDEETYVIFDTGLPNHLENLGANEQRDVLEKLRDIASSAAPPDSFVYEQIKNIDVLKFSEEGRIYSKVVANIPEGNTQYHVVYVLYVDEDHDYDQSDLVEYNVQAQTILDALTNLAELSDVERYLDEHDALDKSDLEELTE